MFLDIFITLLLLAIGAGIVLTLFVFYHLKQDEKELKKLMEEMERQS